MYHLGAVNTEFTLIHGRFGQPEKNPSERQAEIPEIFLPHEQTRLRWSGDPTDLKIAPNTPNNLLDALGLVPGVYSS